MKTLSDSWNSFSPDIAKRYLKTFGHPSISSKELLLEVIKKYAKGINNPRLLDLGCGNGQMAEYFIEKKYSHEYVGVDFSDALLSAAKSALPSCVFIKDELHSLAMVNERFDLVFYSHVFELLGSPEESLHAASRLSNTIIIRFYEPPEFERDSVELKWMDIGTEESIPYIRRKMSKDYYRLILSRLSCRLVEVYRDTSKDQIHVLHF
jgi:ubiquinone/menaquinone biosynthesis C-methylase UbiE